MDHWIDTENQLNDVIAALKGVNFVAIDTEFIRTNTFFPKLALIQISDGRKCWLIDVLNIADMSPLRKLLQSNDKTFIFHACAEDLEVLEHALDCVPERIFDTQIAAGIVGRGFSMGYARLVNQVFIVDLDKQATRSNWLARPLTEEQKNYAAEDVAYLHRLHRLLSDELKEQCREGWFSEESGAVFAMVASRRNSDDYYLRVKGAWRLEAGSMKALKRLCDWRELEARQRDKPRAHVVKDIVLLEIAKRMPSCIEHLAGIDHLYVRQIKRYGDDILQEVLRSKLDCELSAMPQPLTKSQNDILKKLRVSLNLVAEENKIPHEFLSNKKELESIIRSLGDEGFLLPTRLTCGWRANLVKSVFEQLSRNVE